MDTAYDIRQRQILVDTLREKGIDDENVLEAISKVPRQLFMPAAMRDKAYVDKAFPIGEGQTISQPYTVAYQTELLSVKPGLRVLEVGTGSAYQAVVLAEMGAEVFTIERQKRLFEKNQDFTYLDNYRNLHRCFGDGYLGWPSEAPFDRVLITAAPVEIPYQLIDQLSIGGLLVAPVGHGLQRMTRIIKQDDRLVKQEFDLFSFVPMLPGKQQ